MRNEETNRAEGELDEVNRLRRAEELGEANRLRRAEELGEAKSRESGLEDQKTRRL